MKNLWEADFVLSPHFGSDPQWFWFVRIFPTHTYHVHFIQKAQFPYPQNLSDSPSITNYFIVESQNHQIIQSYCHLHSSVSFLQILAKKKKE